MEHPEDLLESIPPHEHFEEGDLTSPCRFPIGLQIWKLDDAHVDHPCEKPFEIQLCDSFALSKAAVR